MVARILRNEITVSSKQSFQIREPFLHVDLIARGKYMRLNIRNISHNIHADLDNPDFKS